MIVREKQQVWLEFYWNCTDEYIFLWIIGWLGIKLKVSLHM